MKVSLVISSYGRPDQLRGCLAHLDAQGLVEHEAEVVLVFSEPDQPTADVMHGYASGAPVPVTVVGAEGRGVSVARNEGIRSAQGELLIFTDDDCLMLPGHIGKIVAGLYSGNYSYGAGSVSEVGQQLPDADLLPIVIKPYSLIRAGAVVGANMFFRRDVFERLGGFREDMGAGSGKNFVGAEDLEMGTRASLAGLSGIFLPSVVIIHDHKRIPGSEAAQAVRHGYDLALGAHYAHLVTCGIHEVWQFWAGTMEQISDGQLNPAILERLKAEFDGASRYLEYYLKAKPSSKRLFDPQE